MTSSGPPTWPEGGNGSDPNCLSEQVSWLHLRQSGDQVRCVVVTMSICVYVKGRWEKPASQWAIRNILCEKELRVWSPQGVTTLPLQQNTQYLEPQQLGTHIPDKLPFCPLVLKQQVQSHEFLLSTHFWMLISQESPYQGPFPSMEALYQVWKHCTNIRTNNSDDISQEDQM